MNTKNICALNSQAAFNQQVANHDFMVVLFTASWCDPCQVFAPVFAEVAAQTPSFYSQRPMWMWRQIWPPTFR